LIHRYAKGGSVPDDGMSAAQLRARHGIASNKRGENYLTPYLNEFEFNISPKTA
jgi:hypothetical protein